MADTDDDTTPPRMGARPQDLRVELAEVAVFVLLILPSLVLSFFAVGQGGVSFTLTVTTIMMRDLALVGLVVFFVWRNGEGTARLGWRAARPLREAALGILLFVPVVAAMSALDRVLRALGVSPMPSALPEVLRPQGTLDVALAAVLVAVVAVAEETIFRGYLILRFRQVTRSSFLAIVLSSVIFALGHGYEGAIGVVSIGFFGLILAVIYGWRGSLVAPIVIHFLQDIMSMVLVPLLGSGR